MSSPGNGPDILERVTRASRPQLGYALVMVGVVAFSINAGVSRIVLHGGINAWTLSELRAMGAAAFLLLILLATGRRGRMRIDRSQWPRMLLYGLIGLGVLQSLYFEALDRIPIGLGILIEFLAPLWVALWARFVQNQKVRPILWPALLITFVGLALVAGAQFRDLDPIGLASAFGASLCFAVYFIAGERLVGEYDPFVVSFWGFLIAGVGWALASLVLPMITQPWLVDYTAAVTLPDALGAAVVPIGLLVLWIVVMGTVLPFGTETSAMQWVPATVVSVLAMLEPVGSAIIGRWWFDEQVSPIQMAGAALVLCGITMAMLSRAEHATPAPVE